MTGERFTFVVLDSNPSRQTTPSLSLAGFSLSHQISSDDGRSVSPTATHAETKTLLQV